MKIDIKEKPQEIYTRSELPFDSVFTGGDSADEGIGIHIRQATLRKIEDYLSGDKSNELGGVLVGELCETGSGEKFVRIDNMIIALHSSSSLSRLTFTHETWEYINKVLEDEHSGKKILGWFHSHPGHTVFLSGHDIFIHENFFNLPHMVAYVFDPTIKDRGFFRWKDNEIVKANGFHIYDNDGGDRIHEIISTNKDREPADDELVNKKIKTGRLDILKSILVALSLFSFLVTVFLAYSFIDLSKKVQTIAELKEEVVQLKSRLDAVSPVSAGDKNNSTTISDKKNIAWSKDTVTKKNEQSVNQTEKNIEKVSNEKTNISEKEKQVEESTKSDTKTEVKKYTIKSGDTLEKISIAHYGSREGIDLIMTHNKLKDRASIKIGQTIEIPQKD
jgi:proteasome lid subunit RPN8/RPN11/LysM repeat protein